MQSFGLATIGRDVEVRDTGNDVVANVSLAFSYGKKGGPDNRRPTQWVEGTLWGKRAEALAQYLTKGTKVAVTLSEVHIEEFEKRDGGTGTKMVGRIDNIELAGSPRQNSDAPAPAPRPAPRPAPAPRPSTGFDDMDDDLVPF